MTKAWGLKEWVENWKRIGPMLQAQRDSEIRNSDSQQNIAQLEWSYQYARNTFLPSDSSGLIEFYRILLKDRR